MIKINGYVKNRGIYFKDQGFVVPHKDIQEFKDVGVDQRNM